MNSFFTQTYQRFFFLIGHTDDEFCPAALGLLSLEELLHRHLRALGYRRIVYFNARQKIYFLDIESRRLARPTGENPPEQQKNLTGSQTRMSAGPLGQRRVRQSQRNSVPLSTCENLSFGAMPDTDLASTLDRFMKDESVKSAVIFSDGINFLTDLDGRARPVLKGVLSEWSTRLSSSNQNLCIFCLNGSNTNRLDEKLRRHEWDFLWNLFFVKEGTLSDRVIPIGAPRQDEVYNLLHYWRLKRRLLTDWDELYSASEHISRTISSQGGSLRKLSFRLQQVSDLSLQSLRALGAQSDVPAWQRLNEMRGIEVLVNKLHSLLLRHGEERSPNRTTDDANYHVVRRVMPRPPVSGKRLNLNLALKGSPGTGKTTAARLIAEIFRDEGLLELGHTVEVQSSDLVADHVGGSAIKTSKKITEAMGGVLFIDEAYQLIAEGTVQFGEEVVTTLLKAMSDHEGEFSVIVAGYPEQIDRFIASNPGLPRRFSESNILTIPNYSPDILQHIFEQYIIQQGQFLAMDLQAKLKDFFINWHRTRNQETFGNAGDVINLYSTFDEKRVLRVCNERDVCIRQTFILDDVPDNQKIYLRPVQPDNPEVVLEKLDHLIGLGSVKKQVRNLVNAIKIKKLRGDDNDIVAGHYLFVGNPGTGKTTVARIMGEIFLSLGILKKGHLIEAGRSDLVAGFTGQTALKTREVLEKSLDGVLFIDEAYQLLQSDRDEFGKEAVETLLAYMENYRDRLCIIVAGYPVPMHHFVNSNPGLPSRFPITIDFENYTADEMLQIFRFMITENKITLGEGVEELLLRIFRYWEQMSIPTFGNGREVRNLISAVYTQQTNRLVAMGSEDRVILSRIEQADVENVLATILPTGYRC